MKRKYINPLIRIRKIKMPHYILAGSITATAPEPQYEGDFSDEAKKAFPDFYEDEE